MIDDHRRRRQPWPNPLQQLVHNGVVGERHVDAFYARHGLLRRGGHPGAERLERAGLRGRAIPYGHCVIVTEHGFHHAAAEQAGSEKGDLRHYVLTTTSSRSPIRLPINRSYAYPPVTAP